MNPFEGEFDIDGLKFSWDDGIFSITLGKRDDSKDGSYRDAYFHPMISFSEFSISTRILRNQTLATRSYHGNDVKLLGNRGKNSQSTMHSYHEKSGIIYFAEINKNAVSCWNTRKPLRPSNVKIIARDDIKLIYPSDLSVVDDDLWVMSNRMIRQIYSTLNADDFNFRIFRQPVKDTLAACNATASRRRNSLIEVDDKLKLSQFHG
ncbi:hypothetical protein PVAND_006424 [Polypedilum vanderplanki]|uniref:Uncharacterized protein n=1 Tax=Polypedilum vanderplanki TaxID=319348 RepID=A0A9J6C358_POLVA|nr:hypothetical protein PVAND_006424 [Polypedilum vanderplanki]